MTLKEKLCKKCRVIYQEDLKKKMSKLGKASVSKLTKEQLKERVTKASHSRKKLSTS